jgi:hypothetical protein
MVVNIPEFNPLLTSWMQFWFVTVAEIFKGYIYLPLHWLTDIWRLYNAFWNELFTHFMELHEDQAITRPVSSRNTAENLDLQNVKSHEPYEKWLLNYRLHFILHPIWNSYPGIKLEQLKYPSSPYDILRHKRYYIVFRHANFLLYGAWLMRQPCLHAASTIGSSEPVNPTFDSSTSMLPPCHEAYIWLALLIGPWHYTFQWVLCSPS